MNSSDPILSIDKASFQHRKPWHAIVSGFGCGIPTMIASFLSFYVVAFFSAFYYFDKNAERLSALEKTSPNDIQYGMTIFFVIALSASIVLGVSTAIIGGRIAYRHSATPHATSRLLKSLFAGIGFSIVLFIIGFIGGLFLTTPLFFPTDSFGDSLFALMILIPTLISIVFTVFGSLLGSAIVFRVLLKKDTVDNDL